MLRQEMSFLFRERLEAQAHRITGLFCCLYISPNNQVGLLWLSHQYPFTVFEYATEDVITVDIFASVHVQTTYALFVLTVLLPEFHGSLTTLNLSPPYGRFGSFTHFKCQQVIVESNVQVATFVINYQLL